MYERITFNTSSVLISSPNIEVLNYLRSKYRSDNIENKILNANREKFLHTMTILKALINTAF